MPNWCYNNADITAKTPEQMELLQRIVDRSTDQGVFEIIRPLPEALRETVKGSGEEAQEVFVDGYNNWYDWQVAHWGTKWDVDPISEEYDGETLSLSFDSAWAPPIELYAYLVEQGFDVSANYYEPGCDFAGEWVNGDDFMLDGVSDLARKDTSELSTREYDILEMFGIWEEVAQWDDEEMEES
jgi:hypothetical protein